VSDLVDTIRAIVRDELRRVRGPELGIVTQVIARGGDDDKSNHQVNLRLPNSDVELVHVPVLVGRLGLSALPQVGDLMLVAFVDGDLNGPVAVGCLYDAQSHPPVAQEHEVVYQPPDPGGSGVRRLHVELSNGNAITLDDDTVQIVTGGTSLTVQRDGDVVIKGAGKVHLESQGDLELEAQGAVSVSAQSTLTLKAVSISVEGQAAVKLKGAQISLAGMTQFSPA
jgi:uncharacterized protein involved in type VI secretion and phage assembly